MLKDSNIDPPLVNAHEPLFGKDDFPNSPINASNVSSIGAKYLEKSNLIENTNLSNMSVPATTTKTPRSSHKIVTPLRKQSSSFLVASLESLFSDSQGVTDQIAKMSNPGSAFKSPATNLAQSFANLSTFQSLDSLSDPNLLQSHVQNSLISLDTSGYSSTSHKNSLYSTPIRSKQSKSHDFSELPSQQRLKARRSSILAQDDDDDLSLLPAFIDNSALLSDLSHFQDIEDNEPINDLIHEADRNSSMSKEEVEAEGVGEEFNYFDNEQKDISPIKLSTKRSMRTSTTRNFTLPSTLEYQDGSKPPFSYASLIAQAIICNPKQRLALCNIYTWIMDTYPFYRIQTCGWQNSIRHNLSLNKCFKKIPRDDDEPGKGAYWTVDLEEMDDFEDGMFKRRRSNCSSVSTSNCNSTLQSKCTSVMNSPSSNNAFLNGTGWSPLINRTPNKMNSTVEFNTPKNHVNFVKNCGSVPMTPLTMSVGYQNTKTPIKTDSPKTILTPKIANCTNRSPYTSLAGKNNFKNEKTEGAGDTKGTAATFWSYPNLSLSQMGLDSEPPLPLETESNTFFNFTSNLSDQIALPELLQGHFQVTTDITKDQFTRMSPLSWLLSVSSQDSSLGLFDQSQQLLSEYLSLNNM